MLSRSTGSPLAYFLPSNLVTYVAIAAGMVAAAEASPERRALCGLCIVIAALADLFDGRFARLFPLSHAQRQFGVQIDSLADVLSFGLVPVVVLHRVAGPVEQPGAWLLCGFVYVVSAVTRLAYYNITESVQAGFVGVPTTLLGFFWSGWLLLTPHAYLTPVALLLGAAAMVSPIPIPRPGARAFVALVLIGAGLCVAHARRL